VKQLAVGKCFADEALENICHNDEKIRGEQFALLKAVAAPNPIVGHPIEKHNSVSSEKDTGHPVAPPLNETPYPEDGKEAIPVHRVEGFLEINFEHNRGSLYEMATTNDISSVDNMNI
jgi:hypothetical protein